MAAGLHGSRWGPRPAPPAAPCKPLGDFTSALMRGGQAPFPGDPLRLEARKWGREQNLSQGGPGAGGPLSLSEAEWLQPTPWRVGQEASCQRVEVGGAWASGKSGSAPRWSSSGSRRASAHSADGRPGACVVAARGEPGSLRTHRARWVGGGPCLPRCPQPRNRTRRAAGGQVPGARGTPRRADARLRGHRTHGPPTRQRPRAQPRRGRGAAARALVTGERARRPGRRVAKGTPAWRTERGGTGGDRKALLQDDETLTRRPRRRRAVATAAPAVMGPGTAGGGGGRCSGPEMSPLSQKEKMAKLSPQSPPQGHGRNGKHGSTRGRQRPSRRFPATEECERREKLERPPRPGPHPRRASRRPSGMNRGGLPRGNSGLLGAPRGSLAAAVWAIRAPSFVTTGLSRAQRGGQLPRPLLLVTGSPCPPAPLNVITGGVSR